MSHVHEGLLHDVLIKCVVLVLTGLVCLVGSVILLWILISIKHLRIPIYVVIGGLAVADILCALADIPYLIIHWTQNDDVLTTAYCKTYAFLSASMGYVAAYHLVVLSVLRGILLTDRSTHHLSGVHAMISSILLWGIALLANVPLISSTVQDSEYGICVVIAESDYERYNLLMASFSTFLPLVLIVIVYIVTGYIGKRFFEDSYSRRERRLSRLVTALIITFTICRLPFQFVNLIVMYKFRDILESPHGNDTLQSLKVWVSLKDYLTCLMLLDLAIRPVIYAKMSGDFSSIFDDFINCTKCRKAAPQITDVDEEEDPNANTEMLQSPDENTPDENVPEYLEEASDPVPDLCPEIEVHVPAEEEDLSDKSGLQVDRLMTSENSIYASEDRQM